MKSKCSFILKASTALVLALLMLFGTVTTSVAAVVGITEPETAATNGSFFAAVKAKIDLAETGAKADLATSGIDINNTARIFFDNTNSAWTGTNFYAYYGSWNNWGTVLPLSIISGSNLYVGTVSSEWKGCQFLYIISTDSTITSGSNPSVNDKGDMITADAAASVTGGADNLLTPANGDKWTTVTTEASTSKIRSNQAIHIVTRESSGDSYDDSAAGGTVQYEGNWYNSAGNTGSSDFSITDSADFDDENSVFTYGNSLYTSTVTLTASEASGYMFDGWYTAKTGGTLLESNDEYSYTVTSDSTVYARFTKLTTYTSIAANAKYSTNGTDYDTAMDGTPATISAGSYTTGTTPLTITADDDVAGYTFVGWAVTAGSGTIASASSASTTFTPTASSTTVTAQYKKNYTISNSGSGANGSVTVPGSAVVAGASYSGTVTAASGYRIASLTVDGSAVAAAAGKTSYGYSGTAGGSESTIYVVATFEAIPTTTIYVKKTLASTFTHAHLYDPDNDDANLSDAGSWPGDAISGWDDTENPMYYKKVYTWNTNHFKIILNNNSTQQTGDGAVAHEYATGASYYIYSAENGTAATLISGTPSTKTITYTGSNCTIAGTKPATAYAPDTVSFTVTPDAGYKVTLVKYNDGEDHILTADPSDATAYSFTMPNADVTVTVTTVKVWTVTLTADAGVATKSYTINGGASTSYTAPFTVEDGANVVFTVTYATGYSFSSVSGANATSGNLEFTASTISADTTVTLTTSVLTYTIHTSCQYDTDGDGYNDSETVSPGTITVSNNRVGASDYQYGDEITVTATAPAATNDRNYYVAKIEYSTDGTNWDTVGTVPLATEATYATTTMRNDTFGLTNAGVTDYYFRASFKAYYFITLYNSYLYDSTAAVGSQFTFDAAPPRTVTIGSGDSMRTFTYDGSGTIDQCGEDDEPDQRINHSGSAKSVDHIKTATGKYYEGNKLLAYAGEEVKLLYSGLATSDSISQIYYRNALRFTTHLEDDNLYHNRTWQGTGHESGDDTLGFGDLGTPLSAATINQATHTVTFTATQNYMNVDILRTQKKQIIINGNDYEGISVDGINTEGYYYVGETPVSFTVTLDHSDSTRTVSFTGINTFTDADTGSAVAGFTVQGKTSDGDNTDDPASTESYVITCSAMPGQNVAVNIGVRVQYRMRLANLVIADNVGNKRMLTECGSNSTEATDSIGTIEAAWKTGSETNDDISTDGTNYFSYAPHCNSAYVNAYTDGNDSNHYLKGGVNKEGSLVTKGDTVTYKFTFSGDNASKYSFVGWFEGIYDGSTKFTVNYNKKLSPLTTYTCTPTKDTVIMAVATRDIYLGGTFNGDGEYSTTSTTWSQNRIQMNFDPTYVNGSNHGRYYYQFETVTPNEEYQFRCYDTVGTGAEGQDLANLTAWKQWNSSTYANNDDSNVDTDIFYSRQNDGAASGGSHAGFVFKNNTDPKVITGSKTSSTNHDANGYGTPVTVYFYAYDGGITVESTYQWSKAYVSAGVGVDCTNYEARAADIDNVAAVYNTPTVSVAAKTVNNATVAKTERGAGYFGSATHYESIIECQVQEKDGSIVLTLDSDDVNQEPQAIVCYNIDTKESWAVYDFTPGESAHTWTANVKIPQASKVYVVPVYKFTDTYIASAGLESHEVSVRTDDIDTDAWGGLVAMYSWGEVASSGVWPGQLMIPSGDGNSFYAPLTFKEGALLGVTFDNYTNIYGSSAANFLSTYVRQGVSTTKYSSYNSTSMDGVRVSQTYDYREPIAIIENVKAGVYTSDEQVLTFALKSGNKNGTNFGVNTYSADYDWEYLTDRTGKKRVDLNGKTATGTATYYVVCNYTEGYYGTSEDHPGAAGVTENYAPATSTRNGYSIDWTVYDTSGAYVAGGTNWLSASYADVTLGDSGYMTQIAHAVADAGQPVDGKVVKIAYEDPQFADGNTQFNKPLGETIRYSGQWYSENFDTVIEVGMTVGVLANEVFTPLNTSSISGLATGTVSLVEGTAATSEEVLVSSDYFNEPAKVIMKHGTDRKVQLSVDTTTNFEGWYTYDEKNEGYKHFSDDQTITPRIDASTTYYAFYSAEAFYKVTYTGRGNRSHTFTAKGYDLTADELALGGTLDAAERAEDIENKLSKATTDIALFNQTIEIPLSSPVSTPYTLTYAAVPTASSYTLTVYYYNSSGELVSTPGTITGGYNMEINLTGSAVGGEGVPLTQYHPAGSSYFHGWKRYDPTAAEGSRFVGDFLSTRANFGYSLTENLTIAPVFSDSARGASNAWSAYVDKNVITQELTGDNSGSIFNDSIISLRYSDNSAEQYSLTEGEAGIVILAQAKGATDAQKTSFTDLADEKLGTYFDKLKEIGAPSAKMNSTAYGDAYAFYISAAQLSSLNRVDIYQVLDYAKFSGGNYKVAAYYKDSNNEYQISNVVSDTYTPHSYSRITGVRTPALD